MKFKRIIIIILSCTLITGCGSPKQDEAKHNTAATTESTSGQSQAGNTEQTASDKPKYEIIPNTTIYKNGRSSVVLAVAEVKNTGDIPLELNSGEFEFDDEEGNQLATDSNSVAYPGVLLPDETSFCFTISELDREFDFLNTVKLKPTIGVEAAKPDEIIMLSTSDVRISKSSKPVLEATGKVTNNTKTEQKAIEVDIQVRDKQNKPLCVLTTMIESLEPGKTADFTARMAVLAPGTVLPDSVGSFKAYAYTTVTDFKVSGQQDGAGSEDETLRTERVMLDSVLATLPDYGIKYSNAEWIGSNDYVGYRLATPKGAMYLDFDGDHGGYYLLHLYSLIEYEKEKNLSNMATVNWFMVSRDDNSILPMYDKDGYPNENFPEDPVGQEEDKTPVTEKQALYKALEYLFTPSMIKQAKWIGHDGYSGYMITFDEKVYLDSAGNQGGYYLIHLYHVAMDNSEKKRPELTRKVVTDNWFEVAADTGRLVPMYYPDHSINEEFSNRRSGKAEDVDFVDTTYHNEAYGFTLTFPEKWKGKYVILNDESELKDNTCVTFYQRSTYDTSAPDMIMGRLFTVCVYPTGDWEKEKSEITTMSENFGEIKHNKLVFYFAGPTDVRFDPDNKQASVEYQAMSRDIQDIAKTIHFDDAE